MLAQVMVERDAGKRLSGRVELDDAYLDSECSGVPAPIDETP